MRAAAALLLLVLAGCRLSFSPLQNRLRFGEESYLVVAARGEGGADDLFAVRGEGGEVWPVTYTRVAERLPALSPDGRALAFVRERGDGRERVVVLDLPSGRETVVHESGDPAARVTALAWDVAGLRARAGERVLVRAGGDGQLVAAEGAAAGFAVALGRPAFATVEACAGGGLCVRPLGADTVAVLDADGRDAVAWGGDSVGYFVGDEFLVRPLGPGRARSLRWHPAPVGAHSPAVFVVGE